MVRIQSLELTASRFIPVNFTSGKLSSGELSGLFEYLGSCLEIVCEVRTRLKEEIVLRRRN